MIHTIYLVFVLTSLFCSTVVNAQETECGANASIYPCGSRCEERCNRALGLPSFCKTLQCEDSGCRCNDGFMRDPDTNDCVIENECPTNDCTTGEIEGACGTQCEGTCESPEEPKSCQTASCPTRSCRCDLVGGFVRNKLGLCIRKEACFAHGFNLENNTE